MKTVVKRKSYQQVAAMPRPKHRRPMRPNILLRILIRLLTVFGIAACMFRQIYWHRNRGSIVLCAGLALMLYELGNFVVGISSGLTRWDRMGMFITTGLLSIAVMIPLYSLINRIGQIGGNTWKE